MDKRYSMKVIRPSIGKANPNGFGSYTLWSDDKEYLHWEAKKLKVQGARPHKVKDHRGI